MEKKKKIVRILALLISINLLCILAILLINIPKNKFNNKKVNYSISSSNSSVDVEITKTGAWSKDPGIPNFSNGLIQNSYSSGGGQTYSVVVKNKEEYQISY